jgi:hypothetical protein
MRAFMTASVMAAVALMATVAQASPVHVQEVKVPFNFVVNGQELSAGTYTVQRDDTVGAGTLLLKGDKASAFVLTAPMGADAAAADASFVFAKDGERYRLTQVWDADAIGHEIVK